MLKDKEIIAKLNELDRAELNILARKLEIIKSPGTDLAIVKFIQDSYHKFIPLKGKLIEQIMSKTEHRKTVEEFLKMHSRLTKLKSQQLEKLVQKLGIKETDFYKKSDIVKKIISNTELRIIKRNLNIKRVLIIKGLFLIGIISLFVYSYIQLSLTDLFAGWLGGMASIFGFLLIFSPELSWKERVISCWMTNRLDLIAILFFLMCYKHPNPLILIGWAAAMASIAAIPFAFVDKKRLDNWREFHFYKVYYGIVLIEIIALFYIVNFMPAPGKIIGHIYFEKDKNNAEFQINWNQLDIKLIKKIVENLFTESEPVKNAKIKLLRYSVDGGNKEAENSEEVMTDSKGLFTLKLPQEKDVEDITVQVIDEVVSYDRKISDIKSVLSVYIPKFSLTGKWEVVGDKGNIWKIEGDNTSELKLEDKSLGWAKIEYSEGVILFFLCKQSGCNERIGFGKLENNGKEINGCEIKIPNHTKPYKFNLKKL